MVLFEGVSEEAADCRLQKTGLRGAWSGCSWFRPLVCAGASIRKACSSQLSLLPDDPPVSASRLNTFQEMSNSELACVYAALILHDDGVDISAEKISVLTKAAGITVEPYWPGLFEKLFAKKSIEDLICNVGSGELN